jgi:hypothetical protein
MYSVYLYTVIIKGSNSFRFIVGWDQMQLGYQYL